MKGAIASPGRDAPRPMSVPNIARQVGAPHSIFQRRDAAEIGPTEPSLASCWMRGLGRRAPFGLTSL